MPTFLYHVLQQAVEEGVQCPNLRRIVLGGEKVAPGMRRKLARLAARTRRRIRGCRRHLRFHRGENGVDRMPLPARRTDRLSSLSRSRHRRSRRSQNRRDHAAGRSPAKLFSRRSIRAAAWCCVIAPAISSMAVWSTSRARIAAATCRAWSAIFPARRKSKRCASTKSKARSWISTCSNTSSTIRSTSASWQLELRKHNDDPLELDELILHVHKVRRRSTTPNAPANCAARFTDRTEIHPNRIVFHDSEEMSRTARRRRAS